jgi:hypothetical protein
MAAGQTNITYGGLSIVNCLTRTVAQEMIYDDSGTDLLYMKYIVRVVGYVHNLTTATFGMLPVTGSGSAADQLARLHYLLQPRQNFLMTVGAFTVLSVQPAIVPGSTYVSGKDVNDGPKPKLFAVDHIASDTIMRVDIEFELCQLQCDQNMGTGNNSGVLSNRWSCVDDIDHDFYTTRTISGRLKCSSSQVNPNSFRYLCVPPLQSGMRRDTISMRVTEDAKQLEYTIVDKEIAFAPPAPATDWSLRFTERRDLETLFWFSDIEIMLRGDRYVDKKKLIAIASAIADAKFAGGAPAANNFIVQSISISDEYSSTDNSIHFAATAKRLDNNGPAIKGMQAKWLGSPIVAADLAGVVNNYDSRLSRDARNGETLEVRGPISLAGAFASYLQSGCGTTHNITGNPNPPANDNQQPQTATLPQVTAVTVTELPDDGSLSGYNSSNYTYAYTYWKIDSEYVTNQMRAHCPIATSGSSGGQNSSVVINLAPPMTKRTLRVMAERIGAMPTLPQPVDQFTDENGIACVLLHNGLVGSAPIRSPDNKQVYRVAGEIQYAMLKPITPSSQLRLGFNSWETGSPTYKMIFPEQAEA